MSQGVSILAYELKYIQNSAVSPSKVCSVLLDVFGGVTVTGVGGNSADLVNDAESAPAQLPHILVLLRVLLPRQELVRVDGGHPVAEHDAAVHLL